MGGNLLHLAEAGIELASELDQAAGHAIHPAPPFFRRTLRIRPLVREPAEARDLFVVDRKRAAESRDRVLLLSKAVVEALDLVVVGSKLLVLLLQRNLLLRVDKVEARDLGVLGSQLAPLLRVFEAEARDLLILLLDQGMGRFLEPLGGADVGLLLLLLRGGRKK